MRNAVTALITITLASLVGGGGVVYAKKWQPYQFKGDERYEYNVMWENEENKEAVYVFDIKHTGEKTEEGEEIFEVSYTTRGKLPKSELGEQAAFGLWGAYGISLPMMFLNPMYTVFFAEMELEVGEKMSFFGAGMITVTAKEKVGGREGLVCQFYQEEELIAEWVIDPSLALPLRSRLFEDGEMESQIELIKYTAY
ncbi:hypothetical protein AMJ40_02575 [candidate division TA06 bacterium DG_26]|uniref:DUF3108 domain-containing protein n=1 Tax=candidate division TA06 bacterium DG_26 TaxID=1703771 RepID=A0A0S7WK85_UNCT6|nr:MAG: hypothetical protein AMJ40_02575 [candidate division TA06 bacterium DG_26]